MDNIATLEQVTDSINSVSIDRSLDLFTTYMKENAFSVFGKPRKQYTNSLNSHTLNRKKKWFDKECFEKRKAFNKARNVFIRNKSNINKLEYLGKKRMYNKAKRNCKRKFNRTEGERIATLAKSHPKSFWKNVKTQYKSNQTELDISIDDMYIHFNTLYGSHPTTGTQTEENLWRSLYDRDLDEPFTIDEIKKAVFAQENSKSPGTDHLIAEVFKHSFDIISPFLTRLYNKIFEEGIFPETWGEGIIIPIFKGGNPEAKNFRGITLNNIISKIYSKLLVTRLTNWAKKHEKIIDNQFGFQKGKSTIDCIFILHALITKTLANKKKLYVAFLDWEKMFDRIDRVYLWHKLLTENISTKFVNAIKSMYSVVKSFVRYKFTNSNLISSNIGVKQGDPASSILCLFS